MASAGTTFVPMEEKDKTDDEETEVEIEKAATFEEIPPDMARESMAENHWFFYPFLFFSFALAIVEVVLIGWGSTTLVYQIIVLGASSFLFVLGIVVTAAYYPSDEELDEAYPMEFPGKRNKTHVLQIEQNRKKREQYMNPANFFVKCVNVMDSEVLLELIFLGIGWGFLIGGNEGVASLRVFRIFRLMWYVELVTSEKPEHYVPEDHWFSLTKAAQLCIFYMEQLGREFFTEKSKGGAIVLLMFFFTAYVLACVLHTALPDLDSAACGTLGTCYFLMIRLAFYDGTGMDFLSEVTTNGYVGYTIMLYFYLIFCAIILLNGLIGIFGQAFTKDSKDEQEVEENDTMQVQVNEIHAMVKSLRAEMARARSPQAHGSHKR